MSQHGNLIGTVVGRRFTTGSLIARRDHPELEPVRVVWDDGRAWRLRLINRGNDPWMLPGEDQLITREKILSIAESGRAMIVVGGRSSGLTSLFHWMAGESESLRSLSVDLTEAQLRAENPGDRIQAIARGLQRAVRNHLRQTGENPKRGVWLHDLENVKDPIDVLRDLAGNREGLGVDAVIFRSFEALDHDTSLRFFGRLRAAFEEPYRPLGSLGVILLGQSLEALDPEHQQPVSNLLSISDLYIPTPFERDEVKEMLKHAGRPRELEKVMEWTGGDPLLLQTLLLLVAPPPAGEARCKSVEEAIQLFRHNRPPSMETWLNSLQARFKDRSVRRIVDRLLRHGAYPDKVSEPRMATLFLYVDGWIKFQQEKSCWGWRSKCREALATEAYGERTRE